MGEKPREEEKLSPEQIREQSTAAYGENYDVARHLRDFERGWSGYEDKEKTPFGALLSSVASRCRNIAEAGIKGGKIKQEIIEEEMEKLEQAKEELIKFQGKRKPEFLEPVKGQIDLLRKALKSNDSVAIFEAAVRMGSFYGGLMHANETLLAPADEVSGDHNSVEKK